MLEVAYAVRTVLAHARRLPPRDTPLGPAALDLILAADLASDVDSPPFDKAMMDGFAVRAADGPGEHLIVEEVPAGTVPTRTVGHNEATAIYTGAPVPAGADAVIPLEVCTRTGDRVAVPATRPGANVLPRATELAVGAVALPAGTRLTPAALGLLAAVGRTAAACVPAARVAVLATGDELVEADATPGPGQIRNSNGPMLAALAARAGATPRYLGIARDDRDALAALVEDGLATADVLVLAGGVSAGKLDLVPEVLAALGVSAHFHKVRMKPGKPVFFGTRGSTLVFGLPGNPGGAFVAFELFVKPALRVLAGHAPGGDLHQFPLAADLAAASDRPLYLPGRMVAGRVEPLAWFGSADLRAMLTADVLIALPPGEVRLTAGRPVGVLHL